MRAGTQVCGGLAMVVAVGAIAAIPAGAAQRRRWPSRTSCELTQSETQNGPRRLLRLSLKVRHQLREGQEAREEVPRCRNDNGGPTELQGGQGLQLQQKIREAPTQYSAKAKCTKGAKKFKQTFGEST